MTASARGALPRRLRVHRQHLPLADGRGRLPLVRGCRGPRRPRRLDERGHRRLARRRARRPAHDRRARAARIRRQPPSRPAVHPRRLRAQRPRRRPRPQPRAHPARLGAHATPTPTRSPCCCRSTRRARTLDVPDPYYAGPAMFDEVLGMIESASRALFRQLEPAIRPHRSDAALRRRLRVSTAAR